MFESGEVRNSFSEFQRLKEAGLDVLLKTEAVPPTDKDVLNYRFLYLHGRHAALAQRDIATVAAASAGLLALAAALETFLTV